MSLSSQEARLSLDSATDLASIFEGRTVSIRVREGHGNLWLVFALAGRDRLALRLGPGAGELTNLSRLLQPDGSVQFEYTTSLGPMRTKVAFPQTDAPVVRCTSSIVPHRDTAMTHWPRDLYALGSGDGVIHTTQRGLRTGILFALAQEPTPFTFFYVQDFSSLTDYATATQKSWADTVGGRWPEMGFAPPCGDECVLPKARETVISDAYLIVTETAPSSSEAIAAQYLDLLAEIYLCLPLPPVSYRDWPRRAQDTLRDLSFSPLCTYEKKGMRYVMPYVADSAKPPESMVQLTLAVNAKEYDEWRCSSSHLAEALCSNIPSFLNEELGTVVRWLPGEQFSETQAEENMNHTAMDSWYLHHALFNIFRLARSGNDSAKTLFERSLPYAVRVAHRFDYRWPIFFDLHSLDIIRAEAEPGKGGETDVAGLYALVMLHAYEMFGETKYLQEAKNAARSLQGLGFELSYQLNTTGFAAEAMLRLWQVTKDPQYLRLSEVCLANLFDNMWLWRCDYGRARYYRTFFGLFPLRTAPYIAAYEELEAQAKAFEYLHLGGDDVRPSVRLLLAEFQKYALDRTWYYYPDALPTDATSEKPRNGRIERSLSIPLEDLDEGYELSGQVGQEIYGAGLAFIQTTRYFRPVAGGAVTIHCNYPTYDVSAKTSEVTAFRTGGDPRGCCELRLIPSSPDVATAVSVQSMAGTVSVPVSGRVTPEGHAVFTLRGGQRIEITCVDARGASGEKQLTIGALATRPAETE